MRTLADFKRRMILGSKWETIHRFKDKEPKNLGIRECTVKQTNSFALATLTETGVKNSWCDFPKSKEVTFLDSDTVQIDFEYGTLIYKAV